jgi:hypothetical protein
MVPTKVQITRLSVWVENTKIKYPDFALTGRNAPLKIDMEYDIVLIDASETPLESLKKVLNKSK